MFVRIVKDKVDNGHKILVFTSFKTLLELARKELSNNDEKILSKITEKGVRKLLSYENQDE